MKIKKEKMSKKCNESFYNHIEILRENSRMKLEFSDKGGFYSNYNDE